VWVILVPKTQNLLFTFWRENAPIALPALSEWKSCRGIRKVVFSYQYYLREQNVSKWGILISSFKRKWREGKTICHMPMQSKTNSFVFRGKTLLESFGYCQYPGWYADCSILEQFLNCLANKRIHTGTGRFDKEYIQRMSLIFAHFWKLRPLLLHKLKLNNLRVVSLNVKDYYFIYNSWAEIFARKNDTVGETEVRFLFHTVAYNTRNLRITGFCLNLFLETYAKKTDTFRTCILAYNLIQALYRIKMMYFYELSHRLRQVCIVPDGSERISRS